MNCLRPLRSVASRRRPCSCSALFSTRCALLLLLSLSSTAETSAQDASFRGQGYVDGEPSVSADLENSGGPGYAHGPSGDTRDRIEEAGDLLGVLTKGQGEERGGGGSGEKQRWSNRTPLRGWGQRGSGKMSPLFRDDGWLPLAENDGLSSTSSDEGRFRYGETFSPLDDVSFENSGGEAQSKMARDFRLAALMTMGGRMGQGEKRKWERNSLRVWGKRNAGSDDLEDLPNYPNMRRRKWENLPLRVWGK